MQLEKIMKANNVEFSNVEMYDDGLIPSISDFYEEINTLFIGTLIFGIILCIVCHIIFILSCWFTLKTVQPEFQIRTVILCALYPIISTAAILTILIPESALICNSVMHFCFPVGACLLHNLIYSYAGDMNKFLNDADDKTLDLRAPPLGIFLIFKKPILITEERLHVLQYMIYQLPFIQGFLLIILNVIYFSTKELYENSTKFLIPFIIISLLIGIWALNIAIKTINISVPKYNLISKFVYVQMVLICCKLQPAILYYFLSWINFKDKYPFTNALYTQDIIQILILMEMVVISFLAMKAYRKPEQRPQLPV